jgi:non-ribosomal peptide synthetase component F
VLPVAGEAEERRLVGDWNATPLGEPSTACLRKLFADQAARTPEATAVVCEDASLTYAQLDQCANQLARRLRELGVRAEVRVGLCLERSCELVVALLGVLKAGGAYVRLGSDLPPERLGVVLRDTSASMVVTHSHLLNCLPPHAAERVCIDSDWPRIVGLAPKPPQPVALPANLAYVIYTSSSTGTPKGRDGHAGECRAALRRDLGVVPVQRPRRLDAVPFGASERF